MKKQHEEFVNDQFMRKWMQMAEDDNLKRKEQEILGKQRKLEVKDFLLMQMGGSSAAVNASTDNALSLGGGGSHRKAAAKGMNVEELRLNKQLLKEISMKKKEQKMTSLAAPSEYGHQGGAHYNNTTTVD
jgi:hypothetical protein